MQTTNEIRRSFLDYFGSQGHDVVQSAPLVPYNDPTLMFVNAGMVPFKNVFTGLETPATPRATSSQKCVRAGGKHNDLDNVGYTARHHTFFEMLGNFSFGDYFKEQAITHAWTLLTKEWALPVEKLLVTVYHTDDEAFDLWKKIAGLPDEKIIRIPTKDNFWAMGDDGPCGPCSEIFFDHGDHIWGGPPGSPEEDGDRFIEIWNLVFMQFEQAAGEIIGELPKPSIDTGMGLERISAVMQGVHENYDIDTFKALIAASESLTGVKAEGATQASHRVIADHLRSTSFLLADGVLPSNEGRGYVLRRIMRRAMRHAHLLGAKDPLMHRLVPALVAEMGQAYPELGRAQPLIEETLEREEVQFRRTLSNGLKLLDEATAEMGEGARLPGETAFKLYDTYGFPYDLTEDALRPRGISVDKDGFDAAMAQQKAAARAAWKGSGQAADSEVWFDIAEREGASEFTGYTSTSGEGRVVALVVDGKEVESAKAGDAVTVLTNQTPFYGESGGQVGDAGTITGKGLKITIADTAKPLGRLHAMSGTVEEGTIKTGDVVNLVVDVERRDAIRANHSATHLLHAALRNRLGDHVTQKGSMVSADRLRFDFSQPTALSAEDIAAIEAEVNAEVRANEPVLTRLMTPEDAIAAGAMALFGEKYGDEVRVLSMGRQAGDHAYSVELCGGTHVRATGDIGVFRIVSESAVSSGVRRVEALTGEGARQWLTGREDALKNAAGLLRTNPEEVEARIAALLDERKKLERELAEAKKALALGGGSAASGPADETVNGMTFSGQVLDGLDPKDLRGLLDQAKQRMGSGVAAIVAVNEGKASIAVAVTDDLKDKASAVDLVRAGVAALGGKGGGGRPDMAQGGGPDGDKAAEAIAAVKGVLAG
ncbi:alanine--tRNA ligase [Novosphingobium album (ex Hu et al. 2023)]|uniref:Alanine--tRNA ligase n=1 Tax=Novosphingobium album (ex Hu et al. 2023) TaxID=2930093 RepID=A0ABT0AWE3_9SPHN|nr:alanine--tRNA ligase [Novosphingobium album (ex Hu et al. 2023)]MCJ2177130.1 alanine--tRNA ligase [Novosphingobium album (ex Hu et al. 2023)]